MIQKVEDVIQEQMINAQITCFGTNPKPIWVEENKERGWKGVKEECRGC